MVARPKYIVKTTSKEKNFKLLLRFLLCREARKSSLCLLSESKCGQILIDSPMLLL